MFEAPGSPIENHVGTVDGRTPPLAIQFGHHDFHGDLIFKYALPLPLSLVGGIPRTMRGTVCQSHWARGMMNDAQVSAAKENLG